VAIIGALIYRQQTGRGQYIDLSQLETNAHLLAPAILDFQANRRRQERVGNRLPEAAPHGVYRCKGDDRWCAIGVFTDEEWEAFCRVLGNMELASDKRFGSMGNRKKNEDVLDELIERWTSKHFADDVMEKMQEAGISAGMVQSTRDISQNRHLKERGFFEVLDHPEMGPCSYARSSFVLSETPSRMRRCPLLGEHTEYVCREFLQMSDDEFSQLSSKGVFK
jgi:benzylsuccinate CoA-transferase BbsF subunit